MKAFVDDLENPLTPNPLQLVHTIPKSASPPYLKPNSISAERLKKFERVKKPAGTEAFWNSILSGGLGTTQPKLLNPVFADFVSYKKSDDVLEEMEMESKVKESKVVAFRKLLPNFEDDCFELETQFDDEDGFFLVTRDCFIDHDDQGKEVLCEVFRNWENLHPTLKKKFLSKPSQYGSHSEHHPRENSILKKYSGKILADGRGSK